MGPHVGETPITQHRRLALLRKLITDDTGGPHTRVVAILLLLYAQPLDRILQLTIDDIDTIGPDILLRLGDPPTPVPETVAELLLALVDQRTNMRTPPTGLRAGCSPAAAPASPSPPPRWPRLSDLGIPTIPGRLAALRQLVLQAPNTGRRQALGFHHHTTQRHHTAAGGTWNHYTAGRSPLVRKGVAAIKQSRHTVHDE